MTVHFQIQDGPATEPVYLQIVTQVKDACARGALRPGDTLPTIRDLAARLGVHRNTVAHAYQVLQDDLVVVSRPGQGTRIASSEPLRLRAYDDLRQQIAPLVRDALARALTPAQIHAIVDQMLTEVWPPVGSGPAVVQDPPVVRCIGSHDFCLDILARHLRAIDPPLTLICSHVGSLAGLRALMSGEAELAGVHQVDDTPGGTSAGDTSQPHEHAPLRLVTLVHREQGLIVRRGNPLGLRDARDLVRPGVRFAGRQPGSGTYLLLDRLLARYHLTAAALSPGACEVTTHLAVAAAVAGGAADVGLGVHAAAQALDLDFVPLAVERYDLAVRREATDQPWFGRLLMVLASPEFRAEVEALAGYDASQTAWVH